VAVVDMRSGSGMLEVWMIYLRAGARSTNSPSASHRCTRKSLRRAVDSLFRPKIFDNWTFLVLETVMPAFEVKDMTCNHCVRAITQAVHAADPQALVQVDLSAHRVKIGSSAASVQTLQRAIEQAGYTPVLEPADAA